MAHRGSHILWLIYLAGCAAAQAKDGVSNAHPAPTHARHGAASETRDPPTHDSKPNLVVSDATARLIEQSKYIDPVTPQGQSARGLYITGPFVRHFGVDGVIKEVKQMKLDAAVIDLKDDRGRVTFRTDIEEYKPSSQNLLGDVSALVKKLKAAGIYTIGRVVCFNDNQLAVRDPSRAILDSRPNRAKDPKMRIWTSWGTATHWLDPYNARNHTLLVSLVREGASFGFDEIQLDYIRFPVDAGTEYANYPAQKSTPRRFVLLEFLRQVDEAIAVPLSVDVFGLTAFREGDPTGLGQSLSDWTPHVEIFSPMLYVNSMKSWGRQGGFKPFMNPEKNNRAYVLVQAGVQTLRQRVGPVPVIRPFLQAFKPGADHWDAEFITEQVQASRDGQADGYLFWHPGAHYGMVRTALTGPARGIGPFRTAERQNARQAQWGKKDPPVAPLAQKVAPP